MNSMCPRDLRNAVYNPFSDQSTLSNLEKIRQLIGSGLGFMGIAIRLVFLLIFASVLISHFKVSTLIAAVLIGTQMLLALVTAYILAAKINSIYGIKTEPIGRSYRAILITSERYGFIGSIVGLIASAFTAFIVFLFFSREISYFVIQNIPADIPIKADISIYLVFVFVILWLSTFILCH